MQSSSPTASSSSTVRWSSSRRRALAARASASPAARCAAWHSGVITQGLAIGPASCGSARSMIRIAYLPTSTFTRNRSSHGSCCQRERARSVSTTKPLKCGARRVSGAARRYSAERRPASAPQPPALGLALAIALEGSSAPALEELYRALVLFRRCACVEGAEIAPLLCLRVHFARIEPVLPGFQFPDHRSQPSCGASCCGVRRRVQLLSDESGH